MIIYVEPLTVIKFLPLPLHPPQPSLATSSFGSCFTHYSSSVFWTIDSSSSSSDDTLQMMMPTDEIDDEETFTYKQNFLQNELNKQNFIYTIDKYRAVFSSVHIIALKVLSHHHGEQQKKQQHLQPHRGDDQTEKRGSNNINTNAGNRPGISPVSLTTSASGGNWKSPSTTTARGGDGRTAVAAGDGGFRIEGKFRFLHKSSYISISQVVKQSCLIHKSLSGGG